MSTIPQMYPKVNVNRLDRYDDTTAPGRIEKYINKKILWREKSLKVKADINSGVTLRRWVTGIAQQAGLGETQLINLEMAIGEAFSNAVQYGSPKGTKDTISAKCLTSGGLLVIRIQDNGNGFDFQESVHPGINKIQDGGMGIFLMHQLVDEVFIESSSSGTTIEMIMYKNNSEPKNIS